MLGFLLAVLGSAVAWAFFAGGSGDPSTGLTTPPIPTTSIAPPNDATTTTATGGTSTTTPLAGEGRAFVLDPTRTTAIYEIGEVLNRRDNTAVGRTQEVAGQFMVDPSGDVRFSQILINARTFVSDSSNRDRLVRGPVILNSASDEHEFIVFEIVEVVGAIDSLEAGRSASFTITGDLTIKGQTHRVSFEVEATMVDDSTVQGTAVAVVLRSDFGIGIPSVPSVASVDDEVTIRLEFVAVAG